MDYERKKQIERDKAMLEGRPDPDELRRTAKLAKTKAVRQFRKQLAEEAEADRREHAGAIREASLDHTAGGQGVLLDPHPTYDEIQHAMQDPDRAEDAQRMAHLQVAAAIVYLSDNVGVVLKSMIHQATKGNVQAAKLLLEVAGVKLGAGRRLKVQQQAHETLDDGADGEELEGILREAEGSTVDGPPPWGQIPGGNGSA